MVEKYEVDDTVTFLANCSENGYRYYWDFGDGGNSEEKTPKHIFTSPGTFDVELKVFSKKSKSFKSDFRTITINDRPVSVVITAIVLSSFPEFNWLGDYWDTQGLPDVRFQIVDETTTYMEGLEVGQNQIFSQSYVYYNDFPVTLPYSSSYLINIIDVDVGSNELMSVMYFNPTSYSLDAASSVTIIDGDCTLILKLQWVY
jgi:PKD repeat protein